MIACCETKETFKRLPHDERVERRVAETVGLVDEVPQPVVHQQLQRLQRVLGGLLPLQQQHVQRRHQLRRGPHRRRGAALDQKLCNERSGHLHLQSNPRQDYLET